MTTLYEEKIKCCVCGTKNKFTGIGSTNAFGSADLDTRPPEMKRSTIFAWIQRCSGCGYCASNISLPHEGAKSIVGRIEYKEQLEDSSYSDLAKSFLCKAMIDRESKDYSGATWALIHASWVCDDSDHASQAKLCRKKAVDMFAIAEEQGQQVLKQEGANTAILVDLLRRSGQFEQARQVIEKQRGRISDDIIASVLEFQTVLIDKKDLTCHTIYEAHEENEEAPINETDGEPKYFFQEELGREPIKSHKKGLGSTKLITDVNFILRNYEKQYQKRCDDWHENVLKKPDYKYDQIEYAYYTSVNSPLSATLRNVLYHSLKSECGTRCKAEDILDLLYIKRLLWPRINYLPSRSTQLCYSELLVWCFDEDNLDRLLGGLIDQIEKCHEQCKTVFFLTTQWYPEIYSIYAEKIETFKKSGVHFTFILFTTLGAIEIYTDATTFIKRNILRLYRSLARFWFSLKFLNF